MATHSREIENLIYSYAERLDAGDLDGLAELFAHGRITGMQDAPPEAFFTGVSGVRQMYEMATRLYEDGTPKTHHHTTNTQIHVDETSGWAQASSYYLVTQATTDLPLQVIVTGRYRDTFHRIDGKWWFDTRIMFVDQLGDTSHHLKF